MTFGYRVCAFEPYPVLPLKDASLCPANGHKGSTKPFELVLRMTSFHLGALVLNLPDMEALLFNKVSSFLDEGFG